MFKSTDGGMSYSNPVRVNQDNPKSAADQFQPWMAISSKGQLDISYFDRRNDPNNYYIDTYLSRSNDGGAHFFDTRVTHSMWDPAINPPISPSGQFIGDYQGIVAEVLFTHQDGALHERVIVQEADQAARQGRTEVACEPKGPPDAGPLPRQRRRPRPGREPGEAEPAEHGDLPGPLSRPGGQSFRRLTSSTRPRPPESRVRSRARTGRRPIRGRRREREGTACSRGLDPPRMQRG